jgi:hypothetical protein
MPHWLSTLLAIGALIVLAPLIAWLGRRHGKSIRGGVALASLMLGFGAPLDPPTKHLIEANEDRIKDGDESGDPPDPDVARAKPSGG